MTTASIYEAKSNLSKLIEKVLHGEEVVISRHGHPVVKLVKCEEEKHERTLGVWAGRVFVSDDFDAPCPEMERMFYEGESAPAARAWQVAEQSPPYGTPAALPPAKKGKGKRK